MAIKIGQTKKKRNELEFRMNTVEYLKQLKSLKKISFFMSCGFMTIAYSTFMRWKKRTDDKLPCYNVPGPKKVEPFDYTIIMAEVKNLDHGHKRSRGTVELQNRFNCQISRRNMQSLVKSVRVEANAVKNKNMVRIGWNTPGVVWSVDDTLLCRSENSTILVNQISDLASRYRLQATSNYDGVLSGDLLAKNLDSLFSAYGAPLFLKRDNGSNLNHREVDAVLLKHFVMELNSPLNYPQYNGGIEFAQGEFKELISRKLFDKPESKWQHLDEYIAHSISELNHKPREVLSGKNPCEVFAERQGGGIYSKRQRKNIFCWIKNLSLCIMNSYDKFKSSYFRTAWRKASEIWLLINGHITVTKNDKVLPYFYRVLSHN